LITASAVGYYGYDRFDEVQDETSPKGTGFLADVADMWEAEARGVSKYVMRGRL
jgi:NAD dependent epimerase/dehydratase family enzyme